MVAIANRVAGARQEGGRPLRRWSHCGTRLQGKCDFPSVTLVAQVTRLPEPMVKVALREYERAAG